MVIVSPLVIDSKGRVGEIFAAEGEGYGGDEVYVVGSGWADWVKVIDLQLVGAATEVTAA